MVLTQLDFSDPPIILAQVFPYHYGSYATKQPIETIRLAETRFHTTMVLTQLGDAIRPRYPGTWFPYHYGSYATWRRDRLAKL